MASPVSALQGPSSPTWITLGAPGSSSTSTGIGVSPQHHQFLTLLVCASWHRPLAALIQLLMRPASAPVQSGRQEMVTASGQDTQAGRFMVSTFPRPAWLLQCLLLRSLHLATVQPSNRLQGASVSSIPGNLPISHDLRSFFKLFLSSRPQTGIPTRRFFPIPSPKTTSCFLLFVPDANTSFPI